MTPVTSSFALSQIGQIAISVSDLARAVAFYRDTLGMHLLFEAPGMAFFNCGGIRLMLAGPEGSGERANSLIYYRVDDIESAYEVLASRQVKFEGKPHLVAQLKDGDLWMAFFRDPDNNLAGLMSEVKR